MRSALTAGSTFALLVLLGFAGGLALAHRTGSAWWTIAGLFAGVLIGAALAAKALLEAGK